MEFKETDLRRDSFRTAVAHWTERGRFVHIPTGEFEDYSARYDNLSEREAARERLRKRIENRRIKMPRPYIHNPTYYDRKMKIWAHNALQGAVAMANSGMQRIINIDTATPKAKMVAQQVQVLLADLKELVKERID